MCGQVSVHGCGVRLRPEPDEDELVAACIMGFEGHSEVALQYQVGVHIGAVGPRCVACLLGAGTDELCGSGAGWAGAVVSNISGARHARLDAKRLQLPWVATGEEEFSFLDRIDSQINIKNSTLSSTTPHHVLLSGGSPGKLPKPQ